MKETNKIYVVNVNEYNGNITSSEDFCCRNNIIDNNISYTIEDAINIGKNIIKNYAYDILYKNIESDDDITDEQLNYFIDSKLKENLSYSIIIQIISGNRKRFNTSKELMEYFNNNIKNISNDNLYDFLLSLVEYQDIFYDYQGNIIFKNIIEQCPLLESIWDANIDFNEEDCKNGIYKFNYRIIGE